MVQRSVEQDDWREKYFDALKGFEQEGRLTRARLQTLYRLVGRLCLAAQGQSPRLDQALKQLRDAARQEAPGEQLDAFAQSVSEAVHELDAGRRIREAPAAATGAMPAPAAAADEQSEGSILIRAVMSRLLEEVGREPQLAPQAQSLDTDLFSPMMADQMPRLVEKVSGLVAHRIGILEKSRQEIEGVLSQMMTQLDSLSRYVAGQTEDETHRTSAADTLNLQITGEMRAMGESVERGADLAAIRQQLRSRLDCIGQHLHTYREREEERTRQSRERTENMRLRMDEMESEARKLQARLTSEKRQSLLDPVTRIPNRLAWDHRYNAERERWKRFRQPTCLATWDIDQFKSINDNYGHRAGDKVLSVVAETLAAGIRNTDFVARYGGEEFAMLLPGTSLADATQLAEKIRAAVAEIGFHFRDQPVSVTISCGITEMRVDDGEDSAFVRADAAMYQAKEGGRNRVVNG
jgi:diguanylate cyclase